MKKLSLKGQRWLKCFHVFFACSWLGAALCLRVMIFSLKATDGMELYGINSSMKFIDDFIIIPGAIGCLVTGFLYSTITNWGWFKHRWITIKWIITICAIIFATFWLGPWLNSLAPISREEGLNALINQTYMHNKSMMLYYGSFQTISLIFILFISILKPWKKKDLE